METINVLVLDEKVNYSDMTNNWRCSSTKIGKVAIIKISGVLRADSWNMDSDVYSLKRILDEANNDETIESILLVIDSPGGQVKGVKPFADALFASEKKVVAYCREACSGGYWIASQADYIFLEDSGVKNCGSIGVIITHVDNSEQLKMDGYKVTEIISNSTPKKNMGSPYFPLSPDAKSEMQDYANYILDTFKSSILKSRKNVDANAFTGEAFMSAKALELKLVDKIGTFEDALEKAKSYTSNKIINKYMFTNKLLASLFGSKPNAEATEEQINATILEAQTEFKSTIDALQAENLKLKSEKLEIENKFTSQVEALSAKVEKLLADNTALAQAPAAEPTNVVPTGDVGILTQKTWEMAEYNKPLYEWKKTQGEKAN